eukprot:12659-Heterococcus_DN1.PRE.1
MRCSCHCCADTAVRCTSRAQNIKTNAEQLLCAVRSASYLTALAYKSARKRASCCNLIHTFYMLCGTHQNSIPSAPTSAPVQSFRHSTTNNNNNNGVLDIPAAPGYEDAVRDQGPRRPSSQQPKPLLPERLPSQKVNTAATDATANNSNAAASAAAAAAAAPAASEEPRLSDMNDLAARFANLKKGY